MKISFITTVFNEEKTIRALLESLAKQSRMPDEVVIVDGGSTKTFASEESRSLLRHRPRWKIITKPGNRSVGRNEAIKQASGDIIVCSDAGCVLDKDWVKNIVEPFEAHLGGVKIAASSPSEVGRVHLRGGAFTLKESRSLPRHLPGVEIDVVGGYYAAKASSVFQKCLIPYVLVMPDKVDPKSFLPATRSMAFTKKIWEKVGGFPEEYSYNEDYVFAKRLKSIRASIVFARNAIVYWMPRKNLKDAFVMFFRFAFGDAQAGIFRQKVLLLFARYFFGLLLLVSYFMSRSPLILNTVYFILGIYVVWSIAKNYRYVQNPLAFVILPILQVTADSAVILGTIWGTQNKQ